MSNLFQSCVEEFSEVMSTARAELKKPGKGSAQAQLAKLRQGLHDMELELNTLSAAAKKGATTTLLQCKVDFDSFQRELAGGSSTPPPGKSAMDPDLQQRLTSNTDKMKAGNDTLRKTEALMVDINDLGDQTIEKLRQQREQLEGIKRTTAAADHEVNQAKKSIKKLS